MVITAIYVLAALVTIIGGIFAFFKFIWPYFRHHVNKLDEENLREYKEVIRHVNFKYLKESGLQDIWENEGYKLYWSSPENIHSYELKGYKIMYGIDAQKNEKFSLDILKYNGTVDLILMGKNNSIK